MAGSLVNKPVIGLKKEVSEMFEFPQTPHSKLGHVGHEPRTSAMTTPCLYLQSSWKVRAPLAPNRREVEGRLSPTLLGDASDSAATSSVAAAPLPHAAPVIQGKQSRAWIMGRMITTQCFGSTRRSVALSSHTSAPPPWTSPWISTIPRGRHRRMFSSHFRRLINPVSLAPLPLFPLTHCMSERIIIPIHHQRI